jgi:orotidine-5'-phosphate decarboxylase
MAQPKVLSTDPRVVVALDFEALAPCERLMDQLDPSFCRVKIGKELFTACGPAAVKAAHARGFDVFLDLKFHDIPATVAKAVSAAADLGVWMVNVHASGGPRMLTAAAEMLANRANPPLLIGVTVLTSMAEDELRQLGVGAPLEEHVLHLAGLVKDAGLDGIVCSALEAEVMKSRFGKDFLLVTPGIRPEGSPADDQKRIVTPKEAIRWGSDYLVIGRPITKASDPARACGEIVKSLS